MRIGKQIGLAFVAVIAATAQGRLLFGFLGYAGDFVSLKGLGCSVAVALIEAVIVALAIIKADEMHSGMAANPHSRLGQSLRTGTGQPLAAPPTRAAWDGGWESPSTAADKMKADR